MGLLRTVTKVAGKVDRATTAINLGLLAIGGVVELVRAAKDMAKDRKAVARERPPG